MHKLAEIGEIGRKLAKLEIEKLEIEKLEIGKKIGKLENWKLKIGNWRNWQVIRCIMNTTAVLPAASQ